MNTLQSKQSRVEFLKLALDKSTARRDIQRLKLERLMLNQKRAGVQDCPYCGDSVRVNGGELECDTGSASEDRRNIIAIVEVLIMELETLMGQDRMHYQNAVSALNANTQ